MLGYTAKLDIWFPKGFFSATVCFKWIWFRQANTRTDISGGNTPQKNGAILSMGLRLVKNELEKDYTLEIRNWIFKMMGFCSGLSLQTCPCWVCLFRFQVMSLQDLPRIANLNPRGICGFPPLKIAFEMRCQPCCGKQTEEVLVILVEVKLTSSGLMCLPYINISFYTIYNIYIQYIILI